MEVLLSAGANPWLKDSDGKTALDWCDEKNPCRGILVQATNKPLSLLELSRKTIVDRFYYEWVIMGRGAFFRQDNQIDKLDIPETLKPYLRFEDPQPPNKP